jgi:GTP:adenosylcobinamide-phosphate guanylyltransferase
MRIEPRTVPTVVMAGGVNRIPLYEGYVPGYKALVELGGRPCIQYPLRALRESRYVRDICVVGSQSDLSAAVDDPDVVFTPGGASFLESVIAALSFYRDRDVVLATTADLPLLSAAIVVFHVVTMAQMAAIASRRFRIGIVPVPMASPEIALDVDDPTDYRLVKQILASRSKG